MSILLQQEKVVSEDDIDEYYKQQEEQLQPTLHPLLRFFRWLLRQS